MLGVLTADGFLFEDVLEAPSKTLPSRSSPAPAMKHEGEQGTHSLVYEMGDLSTTSVILAKMLTLLRRNVFPIETNEKGNSLGCPPSCAFL